MINKIQPAQGVVLVRVLKEDKELKGQIIVPEEGQEQPEHGEVLLIGPDEITHEGGVTVMTLWKIGDVVYFKKWQGIEIEEYDEVTGVMIQYKLIRPRDIMGFIPKEK